jgi:hypothetical protein
VVAGIAIVMYGGTVNVPTVILSNERRNQETGVSVPGTSIPK